MGRMEWSEGGKWDNCNSIINKIYLKKEMMTKLFILEDVTKSFLFLLSHGDLCVDFTWREQYLNCGLG